MVFHKATTEQYLYSELYLDLCESLFQKFDDEENVEMNFKKLLLKILLHIQWRTGGDPGQFQQHVDYPEAHQQIIRRNWSTQHWKRYGHYYWSTSESIGLEHQVDKLRQCQIKHRDVAGQPSEGDDWHHEKIGTGRQQRFHKCCSENKSAVDPQPQKSGRPHWQPNNMDKLIPIGHQRTRLAQRFSDIVVRTAPETAQPVDITDQDRSETFVP